MMITRANKRDFLAMGDLSVAELADLLRLAADLKAAPRGSRLAGVTLALLFEKPSLRTRLSFEMAAAHQGGRAIYLSPQEVGLGNREPVKDVARVVSRMVEAVAIRTHAHERLAEFSLYASVPVINALTDEEHPCQCLADLLTIKEHKGRLAGLKLAYIGDGNNVANSLLIGGASSGMHVTIACPEGYDPAAEIVRLANRRAAETGGSVAIVRRPEEAADGADILYTDVWTSMGQESETTARTEAFAGFHIDSVLVARAARDAIVMHDLPAHRGEEITDDVMESPQSVVFDQAENRLHAQKALLVDLLSR